MVGDKRDGGEIKLFDGCRKVGEMITESVGDRRLTRAPHAHAVKGDAAPMAFKVRDDVAPQIGPGGVAVQQDDWAPAARLEIVQKGVMDRQRVRLQRTWKWSKRHGDEPPTIGRSGSSLPRVARTMPSDAKQPPVADTVNAG